MNYKIFDSINNDSKSIRFAVFCDEQGVEKSHEIDEYDEPKMAKHLVLYESETPIATARFFRENGNIWHIGRIAVIKAQRGSGLGRKVLEIAESEMKSYGAAKITISAQTQAQGFYEALGYTAYGDIYPEENIPHIAMEKAL